MPAVHCLVRCLPMLLALCGMSAAVYAQQVDVQLAGNRATPIAMLQTMHATHVYSDEESRQSPSTIVPLPRNIVVPPALQGVVESMMRLSPTFRRQCARLASAAGLTVTVARAIPATEGSLATTRMMMSPEGHLYAVVHLGPTAANEELLAHEFEHIIEQLDGVDLAAMAKRNGTGVRTTGESGCFETDRARAMGRQVASEIRAAVE